jgi:hypothetical protein
MRANLSAWPAVVATLFVVVLPYKVYGPGLRTLDEVLNPPAPPVQAPTDRRFLAVRALAAWPITWFGIPSCSVVTA